MFLASSSSSGRAVLGAELTGDLSVGIYCPCLGFSAATLGNKCAVWDTWLHLRQYEKPDLLLCRVDSLWQNSGDENLLFHTLCFLWLLWLKFYFRSCSCTHSLTVCACAFLSPFLFLMLSLSISACFKYLKQSIMLQYDFSIWWLPYALTLGKCLSNTRTAWNKY